MRTLTLFVALLLAGQVNPPAVTTQYVTPQSVAIWDPVTLDVNGNAEEVSKYELALTSNQQDLRQAGAPAPLAILPASDPTLGQAAFPLFSGQPPGFYRLWVRAIDRAGNKSAWGAPLEVAWDQISPRAPLNLRIEIRISIGG